MSKTRKSVNFDTLKNDLCIGCGICQAVCPVEAITMSFCSEKYEKPEINEEKCVNCGECHKYCPHTFGKVRTEAEKVAKYIDYREFGIRDSYYYTAYVRNTEERLKSASGGIVTALAKYMLETNMIDAVIHARQKLGKTGQLHFEACISKTYMKVNENRSSFYSVISFGEVLSEMKDKNIRRILMIGTPCVVRGVRYLVEHSLNYKDIERIYTCALSCSHNVNGMFVDYLSDSHGIGREDEYKVNLRAKSKDAENASNFRNCWVSKDNSTISKVNRFETEFTLQWRDYSFSMNVCNSCSDFWGYTADISVKDAWGSKWDIDPLGTSMVILRNKELVPFFEDNEDIYVNREDYKTILETQAGTIKFKQYYAKKRVNCSDSRKLNKVSLLHRINSHMRRYSIKKYKKMQSSGYNGSIKRHARIIGKLRIYAEGIDNKVIKLRRIING